MQGRRIRDANPGKSLQQRLEEWFGRAVMRV